MDTLVDLLKSPKQRIDRVAVVVAGKAILEKLPSFIRAFGIPEYGVLLGMAIGLGVNISPAEAASRLTAVWDPDKGWTVTNSTKRGTTYLKYSDEDTRKIDYNSTDSATLATQQKGYGTLVWYMANKRPIDFAPPPSKWSQITTLKWINTSEGRALMEKLRVLGIVTRPYILTFMIVLDLIFLPTQYIDCDQHLQQRQAYCIEPGHSFPSRLRSGCLASA